MATSDGSTTEPEGSASTTPDSAAGTPSAPQEPEDGASRALAAERKAAREAKAEAARLRDELDALKNQGLSESERAVKERDSFKAKYEALVAERATETSLRALTEAARSAGAIEPDFVAESLLRGFDSATGDAKAAVAGLRKSRPGLFGPSSPADAGAGKSQTGGKKSFFAQLRETYDA